MRTTLLAICVLTALASRGLADDALSPEAREFFEMKVRPALVEHCYACHSAESPELQGGLRLDLKAGWQRGGDSGQPAIVPGKPDESPLVLAIRHDDRASAMPPNQSPLPNAVVADLVAWIAMGAPDPRTGPLSAAKPPVDWETRFRERLQWWSLQPIAAPAPPNVQREDWPRNEVDRFILARLESNGLQPAPEANRRTLARRLSFALTGLPPSPEMVEQFAADDSPNAYEHLVQTLLASPHFGERWARHWMDVVHYADTHGYEWDAPAKNAWRYRDYLIRAFNADVPYRQLVLEQLAGDLIPPRIDATTGLNESLIGPMALRLGERRHGDNSQIEGVTQEAVANMIDTIGKSLLGTTLACAQCHDHKLDAVEQRDYYALAGTLMSTRWNSRTVDAEDPNIDTITSLREIKQRLRAELARLWLDAAEQSADKIKMLPADDKAAERFPETLLAMWQRAQTKPLTAAEFREQREQRITANSERLTLLADFTRERGEGQWRWDGWGMRHGLVADGAFVVADEGDSAIQQLLPAGRWSHVWSPRLAGSLQSPLFDPRQPITFSIGMAAGKFAASSFVVDRALNSERMQFVNQPSHGWSTRTAGNFSSLEGSVDTADRLVHWELVTKSLNNYFPPRTGYGGLNEAELHDPRSWFGVTRIYQHADGQPPQDELGRFAPLFAGDLPTVAADSEPPTTDAWAKRLAELLLAAVRRWADDRCDDEDVRLLNEAIQLKLLPNQRNASPALERLVAEYRDVEQRIVTDRTVGSADDWHEGRDERVGIRGSYTEFGEATPRGRVRLLDAVCPPTDTASASVANSPEAADLLASGRLELGQQIVDPRNPLTARVYVNRVWHYLFGEGLVRTPDDFGHLGEPPTHPELLDYLADRFVREGWSTKRLITLLVTSATWRQSHNADSQAAAIDPENRLWYEMPLRRLEAEAIRDAMLVVSGRYDPSLFGPPIEPFRTADDPAKRLFVGPLDGHGRRSIYTEMTLMEPPRFLALFNQPLPKTTVGRRDVTNVPDQALALLNDPLVIALAKFWSEQVLSDGANSAAARAERMFAAALGRLPSPDEVERLVRLVERSAALHGAAADSLLACQPAWQDAAHALFNLKEFIYVP